MARCLTAFLLALGLLPASASAATDSFKFGRYGTVPVVRPQGEPTEVVILFSGEHGIGDRETEMANAMAVSGALVFEVDTKRYFAAANQKGQRLYPAVEFEAMSQLGQRAMGLAAYRHPILVGTGAAGAGVAYVIAAEAPAGTFVGAVSDGFCAVIPSKHLFSRGSFLNWEKQREAPGVRVLPSGDVETPWMVFDMPAKPDCGPGPASAFAKQIPVAKVIPMPPGVPLEEAWKKQLPQALSLLDESRKQEEAEAAARGELRDLPVIELKPEGAEKDVFAIILTGSGGYVGLDRRMGNQLAGRGVPVVGLSSIAYFWKARDPEGTSRDLGRILQHYLTAWHKSRALIVGYSQGADVAPFMVSRLPAALRSKIGLIALIGPDGGAQFDMHPDGWLSDHPDTPELPVAPEIPKLKGNRVLCIYAAEEETSMCRKLAAGLTTRIEVPGNHAFGGPDAPQLAERFLAELGLGPAPPPLPVTKPHPGKAQGKGKE
jgi:type IV secretory pathway VirJ component